MNERGDFADITGTRAGQAVRLPRGQRITLRVVRPQDADALQGYFRELSAETRYRRFLGVIAELTPRQVAQLTAMAGPDALALLAFAEAGDASRPVAEAMLVTTGARSEMALSVADGWQRRGIGTALLRVLECRARMLGARYLYGDVLRTNTAMKGLARKAGFALRSPFTDARLIEIGKDLSVAAPDLPCRELLTGAIPIVGREMPRSPADPT